MIHRFPISITAKWPMLGYLFVILTACQPNTLLDAPRERIAEADTQLTEIRLKSQQAVARRREKILAVEQEVKASIAKTDEAEASTQDAKLELQALEEEFATYRHAYRTKLREDILETTFPEVKTSDERTLQNFRIRMIKNAVIFYISSDSTGRIPLTNAPPAIAHFLRLAKEAEDRAAFPELIPRRESDIDAEAEAAISLSQAKDLVDNSDHHTERQHVRDAKIQLKTNYEKREKQLKNALSKLDKVRIELSTKRRRHQEYNDYHHTNVRTPAIEKLSLSINKIDQRSRVIYEKINVLRNLMRESR